MENERKNHNVLLTVVAAMTLLVAMVGATFAYFSATSSVEQKNITTGKLILKVESESIINNENIKPTTIDVDSITDEILGSSSDVTQLKFSVNTTGTTIENAVYDFYLTTEGLEALKDNEDDGVVQDVNWALIKKGSDSSYTKVKEGTFGGDMKHHKLTTDPSEAQKIQKNGSTEEYVLLIWIKETGQPQNNLQGQTINATIDVEANQDASKLPAGDETE